MPQLRKCHRLFDQVGARVWHVRCNFADFREEARAALDGPHAVAGQRREVRVAGRQDSRWRALASTHTSSIPVVGYIRSIVTGGNSGGMWLLRITRGWLGDTVGAWQVRSERDDGRSNECSVRLRRRPHWTDPTLRQPRRHPPHLGPRDAAAMVAFATQQMTAVRLKSAVAGVVQGAKATLSKIGLSKLVAPASAAAS